MAGVASIIAGASAVAGTAVPDLAALPILLVTPPPALAVALTRFVALAPALAVAMAALTIAGASAVAGTAVPDLAALPILLVAPAPASAVAFSARLDVTFAQTLARAGAAAPGIPSGASALAGLSTLSGILSTAASAVIWAPATEPIDRRRWRRVGERSRCFKYGRGWSRRGRLGEGLGARDILTR